jgi:hypothetical protein
VGAIVECGLLGGMVGEMMRVRAMVGDWWYLNYREPVLQGSNGHRNSLARTKTKVIDNDKPRKCF